MAPFQHFRKIFIVLSLVLVLVTTSACGAANTVNRTSYAPNDKPALGYGQLERGNTVAGQEFGDWVIKTSRGLIKDAYVRGEDKLGVVINSQVQPKEVQPLARSLVQGFHRNAPDRDLTVLVYAPDKKLILTAKYDNASRQIEFQS